MHTPEPTMQFTRPSLYRSKTPCIVFTTFTYVLARPQSALSDYDTALSGLERDELGVLCGSILKNKNLTKL